MTLRTALIPACFPHTEIYRYASECFVRFAAERELPASPWLRYYFHLFPTPALDSALRQQLGDSAVDAP